MPSSKFLVLGLAAALLLQDADGASTCRVSGRYSMDDAPTMTAHSRHSHQHKHKHSSKLKHSHTVKNPAAKVNPATASVVSPSTTTTTTTTTKGSATAKHSVTTKKQITKANAATAAKNPPATAKKNPTPAAADAATTAAARLPTNILKNPGFEELNTDTGQYDGAPAWFELTEGEVKAATKALPAVSGNHFLHFNLVEEGLRGSIIQDVGGLDTSKRYVVSLWVKVTSEHGGYRDGSCQLDVDLGYHRLDSYKLSTTYPAKSVKRGRDAAAAAAAGWVRHSTPEFAIEDPANLLFYLSGACGPNGRDLHVYLDDVVFQESSHLTTTT